jgi:alpha-1,2-mannosyltransferase
MIVADLTIGVSWRERDLPTGMLLGLAAAIKLTHLVFIPYLILTRQWRVARNAAITFVAATGAMFAVAPRSSWRYFTKDAFDIRRVGNAETIGNQELRAALVRAHLTPAPAVFDVVAAIVLCLGLLVAVAAYRRSSAMLGMLVCGATGLTVSPISWLHHYVWIVPALIWLLLGSDRPAKGSTWALAGVLGFIVIPPTRRGGSGVLWYVRDDAYVIATLAFVGLVGAMLLARRRRAEAEPPLASRGPDGAPERLTTPALSSVPVRRADRIGRSAMAPHRGRYPDAGPKHLWARASARPRRRSKRTAQESSSSR